MVLPMEHEIIRELQRIWGRIQECKPTYRFFDGLFSINDIKFRYNHQHKIISLGNYKEELKNFHSSMVLLTKYKIIK